MAEAQTSNSTTANSASSTTKDFSSEYYKDPSLYSRDFKEYLRSHEEKELLNQVEINCKKKLKSLEGSEYSSDSSSDSNLSGDKDSFISQYASGAQLEMLRDDSYFKYINGVPDLIGMHFPSPHKENFAYVLKLERDKIHFATNEELEGFKIFRGENKKQNNTQSKETPNKETPNKETQNNDPLESEREELGDVIDNLRREYAESANRKDDESKNNEGPSTANPENSKPNDEKSTDVDPEKKDLDESIYE